MNNPNPMINNEFLLTRIMTGHWGSQALRTVFKYRVAEQLVDGPKSSKQIAKEICVDPDYLYRLMRALSTIGIFIQDEKDDDVFSQSPLSALLVGDEGWVNTIKFGCNQVFYDSWNYLGDSLENGKPMFPVRMGYENGYAMINKNRELQMLFHKAMKVFTQYFGKDIFKDTDFNSFEKVIDLGSSDGTLVLEILKHNPNVKKGVCFDLEPVIKQNKSIDRSKLYPKEVLDRFEEVSGNFFEKVPEQADCYTLKSTLHNWRDEECKKVLENIAKVIKPNGKVYIFEPIIDTKNQYNYSAWSDIVMGIFTGGKERTAKEWTKVANESGFNVDSIHFFSNSNSFGRMILSPKQKFTPMNPEK
eukprot:gene11873-14523_t